MTISKKSESKFASRRTSRVVTPLAPALSYILAPTYKASSSYRNRTSVRWVGGLPSIGSTCVNSVIGVAPRHAASSSLLSRITGDSRRNADALGAGSACPNAFAGGEAGVAFCAASAAGRQNAKPRIACASPLFTSIETPVRGETLSPTSVWSRLLRQAQELWYPGAHASGSLRYVGRLVSALSRRNWQCDVGRTQVTVSESLREKRSPSVRCRTR